MIGIIPIERARALAREQGRDLVEISPRADPPVCRIMDFGKFRYEEQRKERLAHKRQHSLALKEIKFHANVEEHDYQTKLASIKKFLEKGHKVKLSLFFRGRENVHHDLGFQVITRVLKDSDDCGQPDMTPKLLGRSIIAVLSPRTAKSASGSKPAAPRPRPPAPATAPVPAAQPAPTPTAQSAPTPAAQPEPASKTEPAQTQP
jgi:translation initiation factor IF-3